MFSYVVAAGKRSIRQPAAAPTTGPAARTRAPAALPRPAVN